MMVIRKGSQVRNTALAGMINSFLACQYELQCQPALAVTLGACLYSGIAEIIKKLMFLIVWFRNPVLQRNIYKNGSGCKLGPKHAFWRLLID